MSKEHLNRIREKLQIATKCKLECFGSGFPERTGFGSSGHRWRSYPMPEDKIVEFETKYGIALPEEYRAFIKEIGLGAGPFYGLHDLTNWLCDDETEEGELNFLNSPCLILPTMCGGREYTGWDEKLEDTGVHPDRVYQGILSIVSQGCTYLSGIIITGPHRGTILNLDLDRQVPQWVNPSFLDWYEKWLDSVLKLKPKTR